MELIPILSFIILVATISTFILAIGAYILYKIRERKGRTSVAPAPRYIEAELFTPNQASMPQQAASGQISFQEPYQRANQETANRPQIFQPQQERAFQQPVQNRTAAQQAPSRQQDYQQPAASQQDEYDDNSTNKKFMKYTSEGYVPVNKTKTGENLKWR